MQSCGDTRISIHALREEGDVRPNDGYVTTDISIHALREEGDNQEIYLNQSVTSDFYPRPPRGGRHDVIFLTLTYDDISIHALREEGDLAKQATSAKQINFYPRPPRGGRRASLTPRPAT